jgi:integrase/recombinase XerD
MDRWAWENLEPWLHVRAHLPVGALFCVLRGPTGGRPSAAAGIRGPLRAAALAAGVRRRFAPHQLQHAHAVEMFREGVPLLVIQRQLGHADLAITSAYLRGIDNIIHTVHERPAPVVPATPTLRLGRRPPPAGTSNTSHSRAYDRTTATATKEEPGVLGAGL